MATFHVDTGDNDAQRIAEAILPVGTMSYQTIVFLVELVIVVVEIPHGDKAFAFVLVDFDVESPVSDSRNSTVVDLS